VWEIKNATFYFAIFHVNAYPMLELYKYKYTFRIAKGYRSISIYGISHCFFKYKNEVMESGKCVALNYSAVSKYLSEDSSLLCEIEIISPWDEDGQFRHDDNWGILDGDPIMPSEISD
jgi:hypothetical protein